jgi:DNA-binding transcriptional LysR family regulator
MLWYAFGEKVKRMNFDYFAEFITLAKLLNFTTAADALNMTQPGLSRHIDILEKELGVKLFHRDTHKTELTRAGIVFFNGIARITDDYADLCHKIRCAENNQLAIGVLIYQQYKIEEYIGLCVEKYKNTNPGVSIKYYYYRLDELVSSLLSRKIDIIINAFPYIPQSDRLKFQCIGNERSILMAHKDHPLAQKPLVCLDDIRDETHIVLGGKELQMFDKYFWEPAGKRFDASDKLLMVDTPEEGFAKIRPDANVALLPEHMKAGNLLPDIRILDIADENCFWQVCMVYRKDCENPLAEAFASYYRDHKWEY